MIKVNKTSKKTNTTKQTLIKDVDFSSFKLNRKNITINGVKLPFSIGDKIKITAQDVLVKTVVNICICEDGRVQYGLEWYDPISGNFQTEAMTLTEMKLLYDNCKKPTVPAKKVSLTEKEKTK